MGLSFPKIVFKRGRLPCTNSHGSRALWAACGAMWLAVPRLPRSHRMVSVLSSQRLRRPRPHRLPAGHLALGLSPMSLVNLPIPRISTRRRLPAKALKPLSLQAFTLPKGPRKKRKKCYGKSPLYPHHLRRLVFHNFRPTTMFGESLKEYCLWSG